MLKEFLEAGRIVGTHGIKGELRVDPWCDSPDFLAQFKTLYTKDGAQALEVISSRVHKNLLLVQLKGIDTIEQGDRMRGKVLFIKRSDVTLPKAAILFQICWAWKYIMQMMKPFVTVPLQMSSKPVLTTYIKLQINNKRII